MEIYILCFVIFSGDARLVENLQHKPLRLLQRHCKMLHDCVELMIRSVRLLLIVVMSLLLASCTYLRYEYDPPATEGGRQCVVQCSAVREMCMSGESQRAFNDRYFCQQNQNRNYQYCLRSAENKNEARKCFNNQSACFASPNTYRCDEGYRACFVTCGGQIQVFEEKRF